MVYSPVRGDNQAMTSGLSPVHEDKPSRNYFTPPDQCTAGSRSAVSARLT